VLSFGGSSVPNMNAPRPPRSPRSPRPARRKSRSYHHGDLRRALLDEALELIREEGPAGFTLREVARRLGVSHAAPYRHFADRKALLTAIAALGADELGAGITSALEGAGADLRARFLAAGYAYVRFALDRPAHFQTMFLNDAIDLADPVYEAARGRCYGILLSFIAEGQRAGELAPGDPEALATPVWAMHHGLACLASSGAFAAHGPAALQGIVDFAHASLLDGLLVRGASDPRASTRRVRERA
jgi:AcrR family transcriptional regulator